MESLGLLTAEGPPSGKEGHWPTHFIHPSHLSSPPCSPGTVPLPPASHISYLSPSVLIYKGDILTFSDFKT